MKSFIKIYTNVYILREPYDLARTVLGPCPGTISPHIADNILDI